MSVLSYIPVGLAAETLRLHWEAYLLSLGYELVEAQVDCITVVSPCGSVVCYRPLGVAR